jgi:hypothetical protein
MRILILQSQIAQKTLDRLFEESGNHLDFLDKLSESADVADAVHPDSAEDMTIELLDASTHYLFQSGIDIGFRVARNPNLRLYELVNQGSDDSYTFLFLVEKEEEIIEKMQEVFDVWKEENPDPDEVELPDGDKALDPEEEHDEDEMEGMQELNPDAPPNDD